MPSETGKGRRFADAVVVSAEVVRQYDPLMPDMIAYYEREGHALRDPELMLQLDKHFGDRMTMDVCVPLGFYEGACVLIGTILLRQRDARYAGQG